MQQSEKVRNVFEAILKYGHDEDFAPNEGREFGPTNAPAGSTDKIEMLRRRVELGQPLWHVEEVWGAAGGSMATYLSTPGGRLAGSLRVGGEVTFGKTPYFGAAFVGGGG